MARQTGGRGGGAVSKEAAVLAAAKHVFIARGFDQATMDEVARYAGTTKMTVYGHAGSKDELFRRVVTESVALFRGKLVAPEAGLPLEDAVALFLARFIELTCWHGAVGLQRAILAVADRFPDLAALIDREVLTESHRLLADELARRGVPEAGERAALLLEGASGRRRYRTLLGLEPPLAGPPGERVPAESIDVASLARVALPLLAGAVEPVLRPAAPPAARPSGHTG